MFQIVWTREERNGNSQEPEADRAGESGMKCTHRDYQILSGQEALLQSANALRPYWANSKHYTCQLMNPADRERVCHSKFKGQFGSSIRQETILFSQNLKKSPRIWKLFEQTSRGTWFFNLVSLRFEQVILLRAPPGQTSPRQLCSTLPQWLISFFVRTNAEMNWLRMPFSRLLCML